MYFKACKMNTYQQAFDKIKEYLLNPPVFVPPQPERPLIMYFSILDEDVGYVLG